MIVKYIEEEFSFDGSDLVRSNKKFKSDWKWLTYFTNNWSPSISFIEKMDTALKEQFNKKLEKEIDWSQVWLFIEPISNQLSLCQFPDDHKKFYIMICRLKYEKLFISYRGRIIWADKTDFSEFDFWKDVSGIDIHFEWIPDEDNDLETMAQFPSIHDKDDRLTMKKIKIKTNFPVYSYMDSMPYEGKFAITLFNISDIEKVSDTLENARGKWNTQTNKARETGDKSLERGYCHTVSYDGLDEKIAYWYIDAGSAHDGIHEFLLKELSDSGIKIKSVEIQGL